MLMQIWQYIIDNYNNYDFQQIRETRRHRLCCCRAWVPLVKILCSGGATNALSMADPASLPLSTSRNSARKRALPLQPQPEVKRPRTRSQDAANSLRTGKHHNNSDKVWHYSLTLHKNNKWQALCNINWIDWSK